MGGQYLKRVLGLIEVISSSWDWKRRTFLEELQEQKQTNICRSTQAIISPFSYIYYYLGSNRALINRDAHHAYRAHIYIIRTRAEEIKQAAQRWTDGRKEGRKERTQNGWKEKGKRRFTFIFIHLKGVCWLYYISAHLFDGCEQQLQQQQQ